MNNSEKIKRLVERLRDEADDCGAFRNEAGYAKLSEAASVVEAMAKVCSAADAMPVPSDSTSLGPEMYEAGQAMRAASANLDTLIQSIQE